MLFNVVDAIFTDSYFEKKQIFVYLLFIRSGGCIMTKNDDYRALIWEFLILRKTHENRIVVTNKCIYVILFLWSQILIVPTKLHSFEYSH